MAYKDPEKQRAYQKRYHENHREELTLKRRNSREKIATRNKKHYENNREKLLTRHKKYRENHREQISAYIKNRRKKINATQRKWRSTPEGKIRNVLRVGISRVLHGNPKAATTLKLLGCSIEYFRSYIEKQFKSGMTWDNHGFYGWHLDHIKPCVSFDLTNPEQQRECFHYTNFQPLWRRENMSKHAKIA